MGLKLTIVPVFVNMFYHFIFGWSDSTGLSYQRFYYANDVNDEINKRFSQMELIWFKRWKTVLSGIKS